MKTKGFTLVELLVVIAIIALLMGILMPALSRVRQLAFRMYCGTNLSGIGKAMLIYANDYDDELPRAGGRSSVWGGLGPVAWSAIDRFAAYGLTTDGSGGKATITSSFYLLVKYAEVTPKSFICKSDAGTSEWKLSSEKTIPANFEFIDAWDFGSTAYTHCSYSYHVPFGTYALTTSSEPGMAVAADRNPWLKSPAGDPKTFSTFTPDITGYSSTSEKAKNGNCVAHQNDGQQVLFLDSHVSFEKRSFCSAEDDNIYTVSNKKDTTSQYIADPLGTAPIAGTSVPLCRKDSLLVHDPPDFGPGSKPTGRCFPADTVVWVDGGLVEISKVIPGQVVQGPVSCLVTTDLRGACQWNEIEAVQVHDEQEGPWKCYDIVLETGDCISVADSHYFLADSGQWVLVQQIKCGSQLQSSAGPIRVVSVTIRPILLTGKVYNLKVKGGDRYLVGKDGLIVRDW